MAFVAIRRLQGLIPKQSASLRCHASIQRAWYSMAAVGSSQHTLSVKNKIDSTKEKALLGGGLKRIEKQHLKVTSI